VHLVKVGAADVRELEHRSLTDQPTPAAAPA
jgi:hypothetical protein